MNELAPGGGNVFYIIVSVGTMLVSRWVGSMLYRRFTE